MMYIQHNLFHPKRAPIPLGHSDGHFMKKTLEHFKFQM